MPQGVPETVPDDGLTTRQRRNRPLLIVHTGAMKGKSTAAFGLALRGWNQGWGIGVYQFVKSAKWRVGEEAAFRALGRLHEQTGEGGEVAWHKMGEGWSWIQRGDPEDHAANAREGWAQIKRDLAAERFGLYVLDEFTYPMKWGWIEVADVVTTLARRPGHQHVVITGRDAHQDLIDAADLVVEMTKVKHPMDAGQKGQRGIEWVSASAARVPRVVIAAPGSGHGKTSVATGLLGALRERGLKVSPHKVGPDYIDPGYHALAAGRPGRNLDPWLVGEERVAPMFAWGAATPEPADVAVIEGVMGLFDGVAGGTSAPGGDFASTAHVARLLGAPVILVVDARGVSASAAALLHGFATWDPGTRIGGVIFNQAGSPRHEELLREAAAAAGVPVLGVLGRHDQLTVPSRHLGLIPAAELGAPALAAVAAMTAMVGASVDLDAVLRLARTAGPLRLAPRAEDQDPASERVRPSLPRPRVAVAGGPAFTFGYAEHPELLAAAGAEVVTFDPVRDEALPAGVDGLVIGGGFPEEHAAALSANVPLRAQVAELARAGAPVLAECAGLLYLARSLDGHPMCGVLGADAVMTGRLTLGYRDAVAAATSPLAAAGTRVHGHEFHRSAVQATEAAGDPDQGTAASAWHWRQPGGPVTEGFVQGRVLATYLHTHWNGIPGAAARITAAARDYRQEQRE